MSSPRTLACPRRDAGASFLISCRRPAEQKVVYYIYILDEYQLFGLPFFNPHPFSSPPEEGMNNRAIRYRFRRSPWLTRGQETTFDRAHFYSGYAH